MNDQIPAKAEGPGAGISQIDSGYLGRSGFAACYLLEHGDEAAVIETNTNHAVPLILDTLAARGLAPEQIRYVVVTHIHLDHAGGAGELMRALPRAVLVVHPRGVRHMSDPGKLIASVKQVYGEDEYHRLYGEIQPVPGDRIIEVGDGDTLDLAGRTLSFFDTPGHARHHVVVLDEASGSLFSGDAFGIGYPRHSTGDYRMVFPSTSPIQFDPEEAKESYRRIVDLSADRIFLTHFGELTDIRSVRTQLDDWIDFSVETAETHFGRGLTGGVLDRAIEADIWSRYRELFDRKLGGDLDESEREFLALDARLNAQGLAFYIQKKYA
jgi:glyoxylase-like metal-dependent hydrolase (beta-lactamase superfamily II)